ncbi:hypothetical protein ACXYMO_13465 [Arenibacterium sp. CAU 1754]
MKGLSFYFFALGILTVVIGMVWGIQMSATHDHTFSPAHAHLNLLGWVSFSIFAFYYHLVPGAAQGLLPRVHLGLAVAGVALLVPGIVLAIRETTPVLAQIGSLITVVSMLVFGLIVLRQGQSSNAV